MKNGNDLTPKQQAFVDNYLISFNATDAARNAGYSKKTAQQISAENLLKPVVQQALAQRFKQAADRTDTKLIDTHAKNSNSLRLTERLAAACEKWLDVNGDIELGLRDTEMEIIYTDPREKTALKWPKQRKGTAAELVEYLESSGKIQVERIVSQLDIRKYVLQVLKECRETLAEIARIQGDYTREKANPSDTRALAEEIAASLIREGHSADQVQYEVSKLFPMVSEAMN